MTAAHRQALHALRHQVWSRLLVGCSAPGLQVAVCAHLPRHASLGAGFAQDDLLFPPVEAAPLWAPPERAARAVWQGVQP